MSLKNFKTLKLAFIGGGINSSIGKMHYLSSQLDKKFILVAGCFSSNHKVNVQTAKEWNIDLGRTYKNINELVDKEKKNVDAFVLLLPTPQHFNILIKLIKLNLTIISEKPLVANIRESKKLYNLIKNLRYNKLYITYNYSGYSMIREIKKIIKRKKLGKIIHFNFKMPQDSFLLKFIKNKIKKWRMSDSTIPTIFLDLGIHLYSLSLFLFNENPKKIIGNNSYLYLKNKKIVDNVKVWLKYTNFSGSFWFSKSSLGNRNSLSLSIFFEKGSLEWKQKSNDVLQINFNDGTNRIFDRSCKLIEANKKRYNRYSAGHPSGFLEAFANIYSDIADNIKNNKFQNDYVFRYGDALDGMYFLDKLNDSSNKNKWLSLDFKNKK